MRIKYIITLIISITFIFNDVFAQERSSNTIIYRTEDRLTKGVEERFLLYCNQDFFNPSDPKTLEVLEFWYWINDNEKQQLEILSQEPINFMDAKLEISVRIPGEDRRYRMKADEKFLTLEAGSYYQVAMNENEEVATLEELQQMFDELADEIDQLLKDMDIDLD